MRMELMREKERRHPAQRSTHPVLFGLAEGQLVYVHAEAQQRTLLAKRRTQLCRTSQAAQHGQKRRKTRLLLRASDSVAESGTKAVVRRRKKQQGANEIEPVDGRRALPPSLVVQRIVLELYLPPQ